MIGTTVSPRTRLALKSLLPSLLQAIRNEPLSAIQLFFNCELKTSASVFCSRAL